MHRVYLGLGANLGQREATIEAAIRLIGERVGEVIRRSSLIETEPWGFKSDKKFINGVICCETELTPRQLLKTTQKIEKELGKRPSHATQREGRPQYKNRPVDIDILLYDDLTVDEPDLKIPHPRMYERDFVMGPLNEIID